MRKEPMTQRQVYEVLKSLAPKMQELKDTNSTNLTADEVQSMKDVYPDVQVLAGGSMAQQLNATCATCVKDALIIFSSLHDRMKIAFDPIDNIEEYKAPVDPREEYKDQLPEQTIPEQLNTVSLSNEGAVIAPAVTANEEIVSNGTEGDLPQFNEPKTEAKEEAKEAPVTQEDAPKEEVKEAPVTEAPAKVEEVILTPAQKAKATKEAKKAKEEAK